MNFPQVELKDVAQFDPNNTVLRKLVAGWQKEQQTRSDPIQAAKRYQKALESIWFRVIRWAIALPILSLAFFVLTATSYKDPYRLSILFVFALLGAIVCIVLITLVLVGGSIAFLCGAMPRDREWKPATDFAKFLNNLREEVDRAPTLESHRLEVLLSLGSQGLPKMARERLEELVHTTLEYEEALGRVEGNTAPAKTLESIYDATKQRAYQLQQRLHGYGLVGDGGINPYYDRVRARMGRERGAVSGY